MPSCTKEENNEKAKGLRKLKSDTEKILNQNWRVLDRLFETEKVIDERTLNRRGYNSNFLTKLTFIDGSDTFWVYNYGLKRLNKETYQIIIDGTL